MQFKPISIEGPFGPLLGDRSAQPGKASLLFLHGLGGCRRQFAPTMRFLSRHRCCIAFDFVGHGESTRKEPPLFSDWIREAQVVLHEFMSDDAVLIGHSLGCSVAIALADSPNVKALVLVNPRGDLRQVSPEERESLLPKSEQAYEQTMTAWWHGVSTGSPSETVDVLLDDLWKLPQTHFQSLFSSACAFDPVTPMQGLLKPVLSLHSAVNDGPHVLHKLVPRLNSVLVEGAGRWLQLDQPDRVNAEIEAFLGR